MEAVCPPILPWPELTYAFLVINCLGFILAIICLIIIQVPGYIHDIVHFTDTL